ncbi:hypothetical protein [Candidatus Albibeggiatoa sp. nov. NOAA]|uniref:hypothetical protein n=1 Tax=Candidatus Albibeggiatoa sp. nov. NOAA TaxID=3162724 RepID=UPI003301136E|nr:hypothetical protein [Thiotrichaceae bacterium]
MAADMLNISVAGHQFGLAPVVASAHLSKLENQLGAGAEFLPFFHHLTSDSINRIVCDDGTSMRIATNAGAGIAINSYWSVYKDIQDGSL